MPNWCVGDLKIRGESADITHFLTECIVGCECDIDELGTLEIKNIRGQAIKGARRVFGIRFGRRLRRIARIVLRYRNRFIAFGQRIRSDGER